MTRSIQRKEHGPGPAAAMCRGLLEDPSLEGVEVPADPELGADFRDWRCPRCAARRTGDLIADGDLSLVCLGRAEEFAALYRAAIERVAAGN